MNQPTGYARSDSVRPVSAVPRTRHIGLLLFDGCCLPNAGLISDAFRLANELEATASGETAYQLSLLSSSGGNISTSSAISIWTHHLQEYAVRDFDALFVACSESEAMAGRDVHLLSWLFGPGCVVYDGHRHAESVLLDPARVHRPAVPVYWFRDAPAAEQVGMQTPSGLAIAKIEADLGTQIARRVSRELHASTPVRAELRADDFNVTTTIDKIHESARWMKENFGRAITIADAAEVAAMSNRNYLRRFKAEFGVTPQEYLMHTRFELICRLLVESDLPVDKIARRCGMGNGDRLGRLFRRRHGMSPTEYRANGLVRPHHRGSMHAMAQV